VAEANIIGGLIGGALIGIAAVMLLFFNGRIAGISGILGGVLSSTIPSERLWRTVFLVGLLAGAALYALASAGLAMQLQANLPTLIIAGLLIGFGTRLGSGCTSGHGVCGMARRSPRSLIATATFMTFGALTVFLIRHVIH
jgi:uncharacterized membrane protein YedE/YeeE